MHHSVNSWLCIYKEEILYFVWIFVLFLPADWLAIWFRKNNSQFPPHSIATSAKFNCRRMIEDSVNKILTNRQHFVPIACTYCWFNKKYSEHNFLYSIGEIMQIRIHVQWTGTTRNVWNGAPDMKMEPINRKWTLLVDTNGSVT